MPHTRRRHIPLLGGRAEVGTVRLKDRLRRLENTYGFTARCSKCGFGGEGSNIEIEVEWNEEGTGSDENEYCPECGRVLLIVVRWDEP